MVKLFAKIIGSVLSRRLSSPNHFEADVIIDSPTGIDLPKVNNRDTITRCEICSKLTIKTPERHQWRRYDDLIVNFEHISHLVLVFLLLTLNM